ncbi:MAG TPA: bifunctional NADH-specific enoyl-ACP reductase/trans-2-enoyl-CoA reductase, partial [Spirochaetales bacterium]|nr:bifunctional NADH-specific enoyl-ACP reductase/trans-2-enoyl-CoA reductase [Spirochaetales bacterium]
TSLFKTMKEMGLHEDCVDQILRLYRQKLYAPCPAGKTASARLHECVPIDSDGRIRLDDWEMRYDVQEETTRRMRQATEQNLATTTDLDGYRRDFMQAHGFDLPGVDYSADINIL